LIDALSASGTTVLVTTHYLDEAEHCHRVAIIHAGRLAALGTTDELKQIFAKRSILEIRSDTPVEAMRLLDRMQEVQKTSMFGTAVHAVLATADDRVPAELQRRLDQAGIAGVAIELVQPSLEDVFLDVVSERS
jgi:ABC-2 type transport system ATP-binding protein